MPTTSPTADQRPQAAAPAAAPPAATPAGASPPSSPRVPAGGSMASAQSESAMFDSHRFVTRLTDAGLPLPAAEALADEQLAILARNVATPAALASTARDLTAEFRQGLANTARDLTAEFQQGLASTAQNLTAEFQQGLANCATKEDLKRFATLEDLAKLRGDLVKWVCAALMANAMLMAALFTLLN